MWANLVDVVLRLSTKTLMSGTLRRASHPSPSQPHAKLSTLFLKINSIMAPNKTRISTWNLEQLHGEQTGPLTYSCVGGCICRWQATRLFV